MLLTYRLPAAKWRPFVGVGYAPRLAQGSAGEFQSFTIVNPLNGSNISFYSLDRPPASWDLSHGAVVSGGAEFRIGGLRMSGEVRYTHWNRPLSASIGSTGFLYRSAQNQADVLLGLGWKLR